MERIEYLPCQQEKPLFAKPTRIHTLFAFEFNSQSFLYLLLSGANHLADTAQTVLDKAIPSYFQHQVLTDANSAEDTVEERFTSLRFHLPASVVLQNSDFCPNA
jgi:hypothetical protein